MKKSKIRIVVMIVSTFLFVSTIGLLISIRNVDKQTADSTTLYTATVSSVSIIDTGKDLFAKITVNEYDTSLMLPTNVSRNIKIDDVCNLKNGQKIYFRVENSKIKYINSVDFIDITSLGTDLKDIFSLEEYNECIRQSAYPARIICGVMTILFLSISLFCCLRKNKSMGINNAFMLLPQ